MEFKQNTYAAIAKRYLTDAKNILEIAPQLAVYSSQQAVEKILKHYISLYYNDVDRAEILHAHKLTLLSSKSNIAELKQHRYFLGALSQYYFDGRYPGIDFVEPTLEEAKDIVPKAEELFNIVVEAIDRQSSSGLSKISLF